MKSTSITLAFISLAAFVIAFPRIVPARASSNRGVEPVQAVTCIDRYNSLLKNAKTALIAGDRAGAVGLLEQAEGVIPGCPALQDGSARQAALLSL
jgi:hypothetical protein